MARYWCTFRIAADNAYRARYENLLKAMLATRGPSGRSWAEPAGFWAFTSDESLEAAAVRLGATLDPGRDLLVVGVVGSSDTVYRGPLQHPEAFAAMFPKARELA